MNYLIDSDILINASGKRTASRQLLNEVSDEHAVISVGEVYEGAMHEPESAGPQELARLRAFLRAYPVLNLSDPIMERFARLRADLRRQGQLIPDLDLLIASTALEYELLLVTGNFRHFRRIPGLLLFEADYRDSD